MAEVEGVKISELNELSTVADVDLIPIVDDPTGVSETKAITRGNLLGSTIISTDLGMASKTAGAALPIQKNSIIASDVQLTGSTADGFAATPTAIYNMDATGADAPDAAYTGTKVGAYDLTVKAESLASGADALGNAKYCQFAGSGYLISTNAVFDFSGTFALGFKMFFPDWTPASAATIISNADAANAGCRLDLSTAGVLTWYENGVAICSVNVSGFDATKFYGGEIWRDAANVYILIDGVIVASGARGTITQKAVFQISGYNGATQLMPAGSRVDEVFVDFVNTHTADTLRNIYARSAKKFAVKGQNGEVFLQNNYVVDNEWKAWTPTRAVSGGTAPTYTEADVSRYCVAGKRVFFHINWSNASGGTAGSGAGTLSATLPVTPSTNIKQGQLGHCIGSGAAYEESGTQKNIMFSISSGVLVFVYDGVNGIAGNDQSSAARTITGNGFYEID